MPKLLPYETIHKSVSGDTQSICAVMEHFEGYINRLSMREGTDLYGEPRTYLNEDIKRELIIELIVKLPLFDCENSGIRFTVRCIPPP